MRENRHFEEFKRIEEEEMLLGLDFCSFWGGCWVGLDLGSSLFSGVLMSFEMVDRSSTRGFVKDVAKIRSGRDQLQSPIGCLSKTVYLA